MFKLAAHRTDVCQWFQVWNIHEIPGNLNHVDIFKSMSYLRSWININLNMNTKTWIFGCMPNASKAICEENGNSEASLSKPFVSKGLKFSKTLAD